MTTNKPFAVGEWVANDNPIKAGKPVINPGLVVNVIDDEMCNIYWTDSQLLATCKRDGSVSYGLLHDQEEEDRLVRINVAFSVEVMP